jgi:hypothetical protein
MLCGKWALLRWGSPRLAGLQCRRVLKPLAQHPAPPIGNRNQAIDRRLYDFVVLRFCVSPSGGTPACMFGSKLTPQQFGQYVNGPLSLRAPPSKSR